ncbi:MAG: hypothetical protein ACYCOU_05765 [Sulfobacillus sp.]
MAASALFDPIIRISEVAKKVEPYHIPPFGKIILKVVLPLAVLVMLVLLLKFRYDRKKNYLLSLLEQPPSTRRQAAIPKKKTKNELLSSKF